MTVSPPLNDNGAGVAFDSAFARDCTRLVDNMQLVVKGKTDVLRKVLVCLLAEGHLLIDDVPGLGKTLIARALAASVRGEFRRIQFTPDLLPTDVTGTPVLHADNEFRFRRGPVFTNVLLADEINRASPKTQSALLEVMEERQVTAADGTTHVLAPTFVPFMVVATQNPVEMRGTHPLPEAQLDRFLMRVRIAYPSREAERHILAMHQGDAMPRLGPVVDAARVREMIAHCARVYVSGSIHDYVIDIAEFTRHAPEVELGVSPRGCVSLMRAAQAHAALDGRDHVTPEDVDALAEDVLAHRLVLRADARRAGVRQEDVVEAGVRRAKVPQSVPRSGASC